MKLIVPTNWDNRLIEYLPESPVSEFYGKLQTDCYGGGRPAYAIPFTGRQNLKKHIRIIHARGIEFD